MINVEKLHKELEAAGIEFSGCNSNGVVWDIENVKEIQEREDVKSVIDSHDPAPDDITVLRGKYFKAGLTIEDMIFALWKKVMSSDSTDADSLQSLMDGVDALLN